MKTDSISKNEGLIIKGIALIMMFFHHFFTFTEFYIDITAYPALEQIFTFLQQPFKICVSVFAFLTGYFYFFAKNKDYKYSFRKIFNLWITYFITFIILVIPAIITNKYEFNALYFVLESIGFIRKIMVFCWYVIFYYIAMLVLPLFAKIDKRNSIIAFAILLIVPNFLGVFTSQFNLENKFLQIIYELVDYTKWLPCVGAGYIFAKYGFFDKMFESFANKNKWLKLLIFIACIIIPFFARYNNSFFDFIYAPIFVFGNLGIIRMIGKEKLWLPIKYIGAESLLMWFLHSAFFNVLGVYTKQVLYLPHCPFLVLLWGLLICFVVAFVLKFPINWVIQIKDMLLKKISSKKNKN